ncbi:MAG: carboxypeptidase-like regulatory domain-containing protein [Pyrinomonadaceae bacterium]
MKSPFSFLVLAISLPMIFSSGNRSADLRVSFRPAESVESSAAATFKVEVRAARAEFAWLSEVAQRNWDCRLFGQVRSARGPVPNVRVTLTGPMQLSAVTDQDGRYSFQNLQPGTYQIKFSAPGRFIEKTRTVRLEGNVDQEGVLVGEKKQFDVALEGFSSPSPRPSPSASPIVINANVNVNVNANANHNTNHNANANANVRPSPRPSPTGNSNQHSNANSTIGPSPIPVPTGNSNQGQTTNTNSNVNTEYLSVDQQIDALKKGKIVYEIPAIMKLGTTSVIKVGIAKGITPDVAARVERDRNTTVTDLKVNDTMDVDLISEEAGAFEILRRQPRAELSGWQVIGGDTASEWIFSVTPRQSGTHKLRLIASVRLNDPQNQNQAKTFNVYENDISVSIDYFYHATQFVKGYWQFLLTTLLLPAGAIGWRFLQGRRKAQE